MDIDKDYLEKNNIIIPSKKFFTLQHLTYNTIYDLKNLLNIDLMNNLKIIAILRNPYNRIISDLFVLSQFNKY